MPPTVTLTEEPTVVTIGMMGDTATSAGMVALQDKTIARPTAAASPTAAAMVMLMVVGGHLSLSYRTPLTTRADGGQLMVRVQAAEGSEGGVAVLEAVFTSDALPA